MARKNCRTRVRTRGKRTLTMQTRMVRLYHYIQRPDAGWQEWTHITVSQRKAEQMIAAGEAERVTRSIDGVVQVAGYRRLQPESSQERSPCTLTMGTSNAVANHEPGNKDARLSRRERLHVEKYIAWPLIGDTKAVAVRPRISDAERKRAESMLRAGYLAKAA